MERENWVFEFEQDIENLENRHDKLFTKWQKTLSNKQRI